MPESKELEIQLDGKNNSDLAYLARQKGLTLSNWRHKSSMRLSTE